MLRSTTRLRKPRRIPTNADNRCIEVKENNSKWWPQAFVVVKVWGIQESLCHGIQHSEDDRCSSVAGIETTFRVGYNWDGRHETLKEPSCHNDE